MADQTHAMPCRTTTTMCGNASTITRSCTVSLRTCFEKHTGHSTVHVLDAKLALTAEAEQAVKQGSAVLVVPCRTPQPLATLRRSLAKTRPAKLGLFLDEADAVWSHLPEEATDQKSQRVAHLYAMFGSLQSLTTVAQVRMAP